ncbi:MAG: LysR family transcriptional regulator [Parasporobacterium sp.]|nr:LysR family transcriptional regulator [Parasporobacterium sp.]
MTYNQIMYFLMVAEELNFLKAAEKLYMTQPALGRQITALEKELNVQLLIRSTHGMRLTPAGKYLHKEWKKQLSKFDDSIDNARLIQTGYSGKLTLGILETLDADLFINPAIKRFEKGHPDISLRLRRFSFGQLRENLLDNKVDVIVTYYLDVKEEKNIASKKLYEMHPVWVIPKTNKLSKKKKISWKDMVSEEIITNSDEIFGSELIRRECLNETGKEPTFYHTDSIEETVLRLETGSRCAIMNRELSIAKSKKVKTFDIENYDRENSYYAVAWKAENEDLRIAELVADIIEK